MKLNVCCGGRILSGYKNVDIVAAPGARPPDILCNAMSIPLPDGCAKQLMCIHGFEHFYRWEVEELLTEWHRLLRKGGELVLEMPDLLKCCENIIAGHTASGKHPDQASLWGLYGDPRGKDPLMSHHWGWTPHALRDVLQAHGFIDMREEMTQYHPAGRSHRDLRMVALKG